MQKTTRSIVIAALKQDGNFAPEQIAEAIAKLNHKTRSGNDPPSLLVTQAETARLLSCSRWSVKRLTDGGFLHPIKLRGLIRYKRTDIDQLLVNGTGNTN